jgi:Fe2+ or Zn2+ uptake regulation protein
MRTNIYREKIIKLLSMSHLMTMGEIHIALQDANFSTIFRNIEALVNAGIVKEIVLDKDVVFYELNEVGHKHDHFVCNDCGVVEAIHMPHHSIKGRKIEDITVRGTCNNCNK